MLPVAVGQDVLLLGNPLLGGLEAATAAGLGLAALGQKKREWVQCCEAQQ
jgi:hypothetical protein